MKGLRVRRNRHDEKHAALSLHRPSSPSIPISHNMDATDILANIIKSEDGVLKLNDQFLYSHGLPHLPDNSHVTTSCNAGALANDDGMGNLDRYLDRTLDSETRDSIPCLFAVPSSPSEMSAMSTTTPPPFLADDTTNGMPTPPPSSVSATSMMTSPHDGPPPAIAILQEIPHVQLPEPKKRGPRPGGKRKKLTVDEREEKAQLRMLRNRTAAQESRDKKKQYVEGLEDENLKLRRQNADLAQRLLESEAEKQSLRAQLEFFTSQFSQIHALLPTPTAPSFPRAPNNTPAASVFSSILFPQTATNLAPQSLHSFQAPTPHYNTQPQVTTTTYSTSSTSTVSLADLLGFNSNSSANGSSNALKQTTTTKTTTTVTSTMLPTYSSNASSSSSSSGGESWWSWFFDSKKPGGGTVSTRTSDDVPLPSGVYSAKLGPSTSSIKSEESVTAPTKVDGSEGRIKSALSPTGVATTRNALYTLPGIKQRPLVRVNRQL
ncbi:hypothetical protein SeLEV6574_g05271 [Synchytrium endobioticum]|uniref:BZIP domain-containing protein n=1 Tax=Synchytrium endobioticum TaxID=286115 RepID=A0A507CVC6_9FUNG|nr:hypothetical protein SeLEV6574_g05271 [Synchytrium endobioticum]